VPCPCSGSSTPTSPRWTGHRVQFPGALRRPLPAAAGGAAHLGVPARPGGAGARPRTPARRMRPRTGPSPCWRSWSHGGRDLSSRPRAWPCASAPPHRAQVKARWQSERAAKGSRRNARSALRGVAASRGMIAMPATPPTHPDDLDSYYMMDVVLLACPDPEPHVRAFGFGEEVWVGPRLDEAAAPKANSMATCSGVGSGTGGGQLRTALNVDQNFLGVSSRCNPGCPGPEGIARPARLHRPAAQGGRLPAGHGVPPGTSPGRGRRPGAA
jgi:hypothetical protein